MCTSSRTKYVCGHKSHRELERCSKSRESRSGLAKLFGSANKGPCSQPSEEVNKSPYYCARCVGTYPQELSRRGSRDTSSSVASDRSDPFDLEAVAAALPRQPFEFEAATRTRSVREGLRPPPRISERAPLQTRRPTSSAHRNDPEPTRPPKNSSKHSSRKSHASPRPSTSYKTEETAPKARKKTLFSDMFSSQNTDTKSRKKSRW